MNEIIETFSSDPRMMNQVMGQLTRWVNFFPGEASWVEQACRLETDWYQQNIALANQLAEEEKRFGDMPGIESGSPSAENKMFLENNALDIIMAKDLVGPLYCAVQLMRFARSKSSEDQTFKSQYGALVSQCLSCHEVNLQIHFQDLDLLAYF